MSTPNINFGSPIIIFDSHPEEQDSHFWSYWTTFKTTLSIAWTGDVPKPLHPGSLRIVWWTTDNVRGHKDYELHQHTLVKESFDSLLSLPDVRRCLVMGFSGQNPFTMTYDGQHPWSQAKERRIRRDAQKNQEKGASQRVDEVLMSEEEAEKERLLAAP